MVALSDRLTIAAAHTDPLYELNCFLIGLGAVLSQAGMSGFKKQYRPIMGPLNCNDLSSIKRQNPRIIEVKPGAADNLFADARLFPALTTVWLRHIGNSEHLRHLSMYFPKIKYLVVSQIGGITDESLNYIESLKHLCSLDFHSFVQTPALLQNLSLPLLKQLRIMNPCRLPKFSKLRELRLEYCRVDSTFFEHLDLPSLQRMYFWQVDVAPNSLCKVRQLKSLKLLSIQQCTFDDSNLRYIRALPYLSFHFQPDNERIVHDKFWKEAEDCFQNKSYAKAYKCYLASVFCNASAYGYRQLAHCCHELQDFKMASLYQSWADSFERLARQGDEKPL
jgi:hypothetical protein